LRGIARWTNESCPSAFNRGVNSTEGGCGSDPALADADDGPALPSQPLRNPGVAALVRLDFVSPELLVAAREVFARTAVPETPVDEYGDLQAWPRKIRSTGYGPVLAISAEAGCPEDSAEGEFGRSVTFRTHRGHDPGTDMTGHVVHNDIKSNRRLGCFGRVFRTAS
jgi:hypothetical protein